MLDHLKENNRVWAERKVSADADFFKRLERQQAPQYLWIGCSDSRVPANEIVGLDPGELFVHRNVANLAPPQDANYLSVLQFAVDVLQVKHILVVGHYGCGGVSAAVDGKRRGLVDHWLHPIRELYQEHRRALERIPNLQTRLNRLCEFNVIHQVRNVASDVFVQEAWARGQDLSVHGWVYSLANGLVTDLDVTVSRPDMIEAVGLSRQVRAALRLQLPRSGQHLLGVARHLDLAPASRDASMPVDQEGRALDAHVFAPVHRLLDPHAIGRRHGLVGIGGEADGEVVFLAKLLVACDAVGRHADHLDAGLAKVRCQPGEVLGLRRAARRVVLGIEVEDDRFAFEARERERFAAVRRQLEVRSLVSIRAAWRALSCVGVLATT